MEEDNKKKHAMSCGFLPTKVQIREISEHTYAIAKGKDKIRFNCYGRTSGKHKTFPAPLFHIKKWNSLDEIKIELHLARYIAANGQADFHVREDNKYNKKPKNIMDIAVGEWGDCSGLWYGLGGVCHQMTNSICVAQNRKATSRYVSPPSFDLFTRWVYGIRGGGKFKKTLPNRLTTLLESYPKPIDPEVDTLALDVQVMLDEDLTTDDWAENMLEETADVQRADLAQVGGQDAYLDAVRTLKYDSRAAMLNLLTGKTTNAEYVSEMDRIAVGYAETSAPFLNATLAEASRALRGSSINPEWMFPEEAQVLLGKVIGV